MNLFTYDDSYQWALKLLHIFNVVKIVSCTEHWDGLLLVT